MFKRNRTIEDLTNAVKRLDSRLDVILMLKEPETSRAAEAYDGLRKQVMYGAQDRQLHLAHLAQIDAAVRRGESNEALGLLLRDCLGRAGLQVMTTATGRQDLDVELFADFGSGSGVEIAEPAYVLSVEGREVQVIKQGVARKTKRRAAAEDAPDSSTPAVGAERLDDGSEQQ